MLSVTYIYWENLNLQSFHNFIHLQISTMDASQYWSFAREYSIWNATVAALQFWMTGLKQCILINAIELSLCTLLLQWLHTRNMKSTRRNTLQSLCDHLKWCFWNWPCTEEWRLWEWEWKLQHPHPSQQSTKYLPCLKKGRLILQSSTLWSVTDYTGAAWRDPTMQTQSSQLHTPPISVNQFQWWEACETPTFQHWC